MALDPEGDNRERKQIWGRGLGSEKNDHFRARILNFVFLRCFALRCSFNVVRSESSSFAWGPKWGKWGGKVVSRSVATLRDVGRAFARTPNQTHGSTGGGWRKFGRGKKRKRKGGKKSRKAFEGTKLRFSPFLRIPRLRICTPFYGANEE